MVYNLYCIDCNKTYIGETSRQLKTILKEHRRPSFSGYDSAVYEHQSQAGDSIDWEHVHILDSDDQDLPRKIKEALQIKYNKPRLNRDQGHHLSDSYNVILTSSLKQNADVTYMLSSNNTKQPSVL